MYVSKYNLQIKVSSPSLVCASDLTKFARLVAANLCKLFFNCCITYLKNPPLIDKKNFTSHVSQTISSCLNGWFWGRNENWTSCLEM